MKKTEVDWDRFDELKDQGLPMKSISEAMGIPRTTLGPLAKKRDTTHHSTLMEHHDTPQEHQGTPEAPDLWTEHRSTPEHTERMSDQQDTQEHHSTPDELDISEGHPSTPDVMETVVRSYAVHLSTPEHPITSEGHHGTPQEHQEMSEEHSGIPEEYSGVPVRRDHFMSTPMVHPGTPTAEDWELWHTIKARWLEVEKMLADRQALLRTPSGTPGHTQKKTYVFDSRHIALIDRYAEDHRLDLKDVLYAALQEFFEHRGYLPQG